MFKPDLKLFLEKTKIGNLIPVYKEIFADMETPVTAFRKLYSKRYAFLLESVEGGEKIGRYSFLGFDPDMIFSAKDDSVIITKSTGEEIVHEKTRNPFGRLKELVTGVTFVEDEHLPRFSGGAVGFIGYGMVHHFDNISQNNDDNLFLPDMSFFICNTYIIFDHIKHVIQVVRNVAITEDPKKDYEKACQRIDTVIELLNTPLSYEPIESTVVLSEVKADSNVTKDAFETMVKKAKDYIYEGDIIQVVLSQQFKTKIKTSGFEIYRALRSVNPSPYMYILKYDDCEIVGASPEVMVRCEDRKVEVRPIAGTRPRGNNEQEDKKFEKELLQDPKECAEHIMLLDLGRNDVGRVCDYETVQVNDCMIIERYSHVMHIVSDVTGTLSEKKDHFDALQAAFPAGTVTGAPKIRAMQIIEELEGSKRGPYAGAIGYFSFSGDLDSCITIRTLVIKENMAYVQAGAGIVADSVPETEYIETVNKAQALLKAIAMAEAFHKKKK
ncbi:anthranilate synthase component I [Chlamydiota bacterium]